MEDRGYTKVKILHNNKIASNIYKIRLEGDFIANPGQFYMIRAWRSYPYLSRPISIFDIGDGYIEFLYAVVGEGTEILSNKTKGETIEILGPLGNGFDINRKYENVALICGGIGIAPLYYLAKKLDAKSIDLLAGFRDEIYCIDKFADYTNIYIATEDGSSGEKGYVTNLIKDKKYDVAFVCGPNIMMSAIKNIKPAEETFLSLEAHMGCGIGACLGCQIKVKGRGIQRICHDGPVFNANEVELNA